MGNERSFVTFHSHIVDDSKFSDSGEILVPGGEIISRHLLEILRASGFLISVSTQHQFYGWEFSAEIGGQKFWFLLQYPDPWLLIVENRTGILGRLKKNSISLHDVLVRLSDGICNKNIFDHARWFTKAEYESGVSQGALLP